MDSFQDEYSLNLIDYDRIIGDAASTDFYWSNQSCCVEFDGSSAGVGAGAVFLENGCSQKSACVELDASSAGAVFLEKGCLQKGELDASSAGAVSIENGSMRKRGRNESCSGAGSKACREKMRRDKMNDRFTDLSSILEPGRPAKTDKSAILNDAIRVLNQLRAEAQELKEANEKLQEDIKNLKAEKNELREEKLVLKADKERIEQQVKGMAVVPGGFVPPHPATYQAGVNKLMTFPSYGGYPMWQWIPPATLDTSQDHVLRPPVA